MVHYLGCLKADPSSYRTRIEILQALVDVYSESPKTFSGLLLKGCLLTLRLKFPYLRTSFLRLIVSETSSNQKVKNLQPSQIAVSAMLAGFAVFMIWDQFYWWMNREDYSFGFLVPLFVIYVICHYWPDARSYLFRGAKPGEEAAPAVSDVRTSLVEVLASISMAASLVLFVIGTFVRAASGPENTISLLIALSFAVLMLSSVFIFSKERADGQPMCLKARFSLTLLFLFPALIWLLSAPMLATLETKISVFLLNKITFVVFNSLDFLGYEISRKGAIIELPEGNVHVEEACSGIRSLMACLFAGSFLATVFLDRFWKKVMLVVAAMGFAILTNLIRSMFLTLWSYYHGSHAIDEHWILPVFGDIGTVHDVTGMAILVVTCIGLMCLLPIFNYKLPEFDDEVEAKDMAAPKTEDA